MPATSARRRIPALPLWSAMVLALAGGYGLSLAFPGRSWWWIAIPSLALLFIAFRERRTGSSILVGFLAGEAFYLPLVRWSSLFLGPLPWIALATVEALWFALGALLCTLAYRWWPRVWHGMLARAARAGFVGGLWLLRELASNHIPYGGFAWGRLGQSQADSLLAGWYSWIGVSGVSFLVASMAAGLADVLWHIRGDKRWGRHGLLLALGSAALCCLPAYELPAQRDYTVAAVQGGSDRAGYFHQGQPGEIQRLHALTTTQLDPQRHYDLIVWPETAAEWDPAAEPGTRAVIQNLSAQYQAPLLVGAVREQDELIYNSVDLWTAHERLGQFDKRDPVPFGEYIPHRKFWSFFAPQQIAMVQRGYTAGTTSPVLQAPTAKLGTAICFDVIDDALMRESVRGGADILLYPTNNADFGQTDELDQQVTFARLRAMESGRSVVQVSTVGYTAAFTPDGHELAVLPWYTPGTMVVTVPIMTGTTPALILAQPLAGAITGFAGVLLCALGALARRTHRRIPRPHSS